MTRIRIAQIRIVPEKRNLQANHDKLMSALAELDSASADVVVTPECFLDGYVAPEDRINSKNIKDYAIDPSSSPYVRGLSEWARDNSTWVVFGCTRLSTRGVYNTALILKRSGELIGFYDKTHCQLHDTKYVPGEKLSVFESDFGTFGIVICADRRWPETIRSLAIQGARVIFNPTYGDHDENNLRMMQTRSYESEIFIAFTHPHQSLLTDPTGKIICNETEPDKQFALNEIDLSQVDKVRAGGLAHLRDRRPELYTS